MYQKYPYSFILSILTLFTVSCRSTASDVNVTNGIDATNFYSGVVLIDTPKGSNCTGVVMSNNVVLTAAHCTLDKTGKPSNRAIKVRLQNGKAFLVKKYYIHPSFEADYANNGGLLNFNRNSTDIAILIFDGNPFSNVEHYKILKKLKFDIGSTVTMVGFGCPTTTEDVPDTGLKLVWCQENNDRYQRRAGLNKLAEGDWCGTSMLQVNTEGFKPDDQISNPNGQNVSVFSGDSGSPLFLGAYSHTLLGITGSGQFFMTSDNVLHSCFSNLYNSQNASFLLSVIKKEQLDIGLVE